MILYNDIAYIIAGRLCHNLFTTSITLRRLRCPISARGRAARVQLFHTW